MDTRRPTQTELLTNTSVGERRAATSLVQHRHAITDATATPLRVQLCDASVDATCLKEEEYYI